MVQDRLRDGTRIAQLVASELTGDRNALQQVVVVDADPDVEPTEDGALAYRVALVSEPEAVDVGERGQTTVDETVGADQTVLGSVFVHPERARIEFTVAPDAAAETAQSVELRSRPKAVDPPQTLVFVEDGAEAKRVMAVFKSVVGTVDEPAGSTDPK
jgi:hypothetical protein